MARPAPIVRPKIKVTYWKKIDRGYVQFKDVVCESGINPEAVLQDGNTDQGEAHTFPDGETGLGVVVHGWSGQSAQYVRRDAINSYMGWDEDLDDPEVYIWRKVTSTTRGARKFVASFVAARHDRLMNEVIAHPVTKKSAHQLNRLYAKPLPLP